MALAPRLYKDGTVWTYSDGRTDAIKTAPAGNYRRLIDETKVAIMGKHNVFSLFKPQYYEVTDIQKSETLGDNYATIEEFIGATVDFFVNPSRGGIIAGTVVDYSQLPTASLHYGELWYVENGSGGYLAWIKLFKYPKGLYSVNSLGVWELVPMNVRYSEDALTLLNITNWSDYLAYAFDINAGDRIVYNDTQYKNLTGVQISTSPETDSVNWEAIGFAANVITQNTTLAKGSKNIVESVPNVIVTLFSNPTINDALNINNDSGGSIVLNGNGKLIYDSALITLYNGESLHLVFLNDKWNVI